MCVYLQNQINLELNLEPYRSALADYESADSRKNWSSIVFLEKRKSISLFAFIKYLNLRLKLKTQTLLAPEIELKLN